MEVDYTDEFNLTSVKYVYKFDDLKPDELILWLNHLQYNNFYVKNPRKILFPCLGGDYKLFSKTIGTSHIIIVSLDWIIKDEETHKIIQMVTPINLKRFGITAIDNIPILNHDKGSIDFRQDKVLQYVNFGLRLQCFCKLISEILRKAPDVTNIPNDQMEKFKSINREAFQSFENDLNNDILKYDLLSKPYLKEFAFMYHKIDGTHYGQDYSNNERSLAHQLGYQSSWNRLRGVSFINYYFVKWNYQNEEYTLVSIFDFDESQTYILDKNGKIDRKVFHDIYLANDNEGDDEIILSLHQRIYAFISIRDNPENFT